MTRAKRKVAIDKWQVIIMIHKIVIRLEMLENNI